VLIYAVGLHGQQEMPLNMVALGDSLTEGVPHLNEPTDTYPFQLAQQFPGSCYRNLAYRDV
jgi:hypothetical protein